MLRAKRSASVLASLALSAATAAGGQWKYNEQHSYGSDSIHLSGTSSWSFVDMHLSATGGGVAGNSIAYADLFFSANESLTVSGFVVETWTYLPAPGDSLNGEVEYEGWMELECVAAVVRGPAVTRSKGEIELEILIDSAPIFTQMVHLDLVQNAGREKAVDVSGGVEGGGVSLTGSVPINLSQGEGENRGKHVEPIPFNAKCARTIQRIQTSQVTHSVSIEWPWNVQVAHASAETLGLINWNIWVLITECPE